MKRFARILARQLVVAAALLCPLSIPAMFWKLNTVIAVMRIQSVCVWPVLSLQTRGKHWKLEQNSNRGGGGVAE